MTWKPIIAAMGLAIFLCLCKTLPPHTFWRSESHLSSRHLGLNVKHYLKQRGHNRHRKKQVAILRPFATKIAPRLHQTFDSWNDYLPCDTKRSTEKGGDNGEEYEFHIILSYSQSYNASFAADWSTSYLIENFNSFKWSQGCISSIQRIETNIPPGEDLYNPSEAGSNRMWVNGPNSQFIDSIDIVQTLAIGEDTFDYIILMESDVAPVQQYWLDTLMDEVTQEISDNGEFAILGSEYVGRAWDEFRSSLPLPLLHHINGNAVYNLRHPLVQFILQQLWNERERREVYHGISYDYRISQILLEGFLGITPNLPGGVVKQWKLEHAGQEVRNNKNDFGEAWRKYGVIDGAMSIRRSKVIQNFSGTNLLRRHVEESGASLIHGANFYHSWQENSKVSTFSLKVHLTTISLSLSLTGFLLFYRTSR